MLVSLALESCQCWRSELQTWLVSPSDEMMGGQKDKDSPEQDDGHAPTGRTWSGRILGQLFVQSFMRLSGPSRPGTGPLDCAAWRGHLPVSRNRALTAHKVRAARGSLDVVQRGRSSVLSFLLLVFILAQSPDFSVTFFPSLRSLKNRTRFLTENRTSHIYLYTL